MSKEPKRSFWDSLGKIFRGREEELPEGTDYCEMCGKIYPEEEIHHVIGYRGTREEIYLCESCTDLSPSTWRKNFIYKMGHKH